MSGLQTERLLCLIIAVGGPWFNPTLVIAQFQEYTDSLIKELHQSIFEKGHGDGEALVYSQLVRCGTAPASVKAADSKPSPVLGDGDTPDVSPRPPGDNVQL